MTSLVRRGRRYFSVALAIVAVLTVAVAAARTGGGAAAQVGEPWPAFTMTWRETANNLGWNGTQGTQVFRLEYTDRRHWRVTMLENPALPGAVGATWTFDGRTSTFHDPRRDTDEVHPYGPDEVTVPSAWLVPGRVAALLTRPGYSSMSVGKGLGLLWHEETLPDGKVSREETTYRLADLIPTGRVITVDGVEVSREEVTDFQLTTP
jgi:hypothetical protein